MTAHERLVSARNEIDRSGWIQLDPGNHQEGPNPRCAYNAIANLEFDAGCWEAMEVFRRVIGMDNIPKWNDAVGRTKAEVLAALDKAIRITAPPPPDHKWSEIVEELETTKAVVA